MNRLKLCCCLFLFHLIINHQGFSQSKVWVTIQNVDHVPYQSTNRQLISNDSVFNVYINSLNIFSCTQALPSSRNKMLQKVYELTSSSSQNELEQTLTNYVHAVSGIYPAPIYDTLHTPNDYTLVPGINNYALNLINAQTAWDITLGDSNVVIAITDQSYSPNHSELLGKYAYINAGTSTPTHGNAVAILAAGNTNNNNGLSSIGYNCKLALYIMSYNEVLNAAYAGAKVINMSWTAGCFYNNYAEQAINEAYGVGAFLVAAAGNGNTCSNPAAYVYPAAFDNVFSVTSIGPLDNHMKILNDPTSTHQHNDKVDLSAPGYDVAINPAENWYLNSSGTSFASPIVSGTVGLMLSVNPCLSRKDIDTILKISSVNIDSLNPTYIGLIGKGRLNAQAAVQLSSGWASQPMGVTTQPIGVSISVGGNAQFSVSSTSSFPIYQWQRDSSGIFVNLINNNDYSGVNTSILTVSNAPATFNNTQYRCIMKSGYCQAISNAATLVVSSGILPEDAGIIHGDTLVCFGDTVQIAINPVNFATGYNWTINGNANIISGTNTNSITIQIFDTTVGISVTPYNTFGSSNSSSISIATIPLPTGFLSGNPSVCPGNAATLTMNVTGQGPWFGTINNSISFSGTSNPIQIIVYPDSTTIYNLQELYTLDGCNAYPDYLSSSASVTVLPYNRDTIHTTICTSQLPFQWNGINITNAGYYSDTISNSVGCDSIITLHLTVINGNPPAAPLSITQTLVDTICFARVYRYTASITNNAQGYKWIIPTSCGGVSSVIVDSGDINVSRVIRLKYFSNNAAFITDSIKVSAYNSCGMSPYKHVILINTLLSAPLPPTSIIATPLITNVCGQRKIRYTAPNLPVGTANITAATGYFWSFTSPTPLLAQLDSGTFTSKIIVVKYVSNNAAQLGDSIYLNYTSACGNSIKKSLKINLTALNVPAAPTSITITPLITNICGQRKYRCTMPLMPSATTTSGAATGYLWTLTGNVVTYGVIDSGSLTSRIMVLKYTDNNATFVGDSLKAQYSSGCGLSNFIAIKFSVPKITPPLAPTAITITPVSIGTCGAKIYRYTMPLVTAGTISNAAATGYAWEFVGILSSTATIDSGTLNSRIIRMKFVNNNAATIGDSVRAYYLSSCGNGSVKSTKLNNANLTAPAMPASIGISLVSDVCGNRIYRYSAPVLPSSTTTAMAATGYQWFLPTGSAVAASASLDSGVLIGANARFIKLKFTNNGAAGNTDSIRLRYTSGCGNSATKAQKLSNVAISTLSSPSTLTGITSICSIVGTATATRYTVSTLSGAISYLWTLPTGAILDSGSNGLKIKVRFITAGANDSIYVQGIGANGCAGAKKVLKLITTNCITFPTSKLANSIEEKGRVLDASIYPNPTMSAFQLMVKSSRQSKTVTARIIDSQGRQIKMLSFNSNEIVSFGNELRSGVYLVEVIDGDSVKMMKVVKY
jgi:hypothetical protein